MADNMEYSENLKKMKVPELKNLLKSKGLSSAGTKPDLIKRLVESEGSSIDSNDPVLDEDEILKDDPAPSVTAVPPISANASSKDKGDSATNGVSKSAAPDNIQMPADTTVAAKPTEVTKLTDAERLKLRVEKFGVVSEKTKKELRAQRFALDTKSGNNSSSIGSVPIDVEKLKMRAERFGTSTSSVTEDEKKRKRAERFGSSAAPSATKTSISLNSTDSELEAKKRKRAERFALSS